MNTYKISIIVPIYGVEKYIERCARSLFEQTYNNIEFIFINDCTNDKSIDILKTVIEDYPKRRDNIIIISHEYNRGLAAARNSGLEKCSGDYLIHLDSDDWLELDAIEKLSTKINQKETDIILFGYKNIFTDKKIISSIHFINKEQYIKSILMHSTPASIWSKLYRTDFYIQSGIKSIEGLNHGEDYVVVPRLIHKANKIEILDTPLYNYNLTNTGSYTKNISSKSIKNLLLAADVVFKYFTNIKDSNLYKKETSLLHIRTMLALIKMGNKESYKEIYTSFKPYLKCNINQLSFSDRVLYLLLKLGLHQVLFYLIQVYRRQYS